MKKSDPAAGGHHRTRLLRLFQRTRQHKSQELQRPGSGIRGLLSSGRRRTRLQGDWSSDVCSSDLNAQLLGKVYLGSLDEAGALKVAREFAADIRSEERRVGKECRSRWSPYHSK